MTRSSPRADDYGTALAQALPWLDAIDEFADAARALLDGTGSQAELARTLHNYRQTAIDQMGEPGDSTPQEGRGAAYPGLSELRYPG